MKNLFLAFGLLLTLQVSGQTHYPTGTKNAQQNWFTYFGQYKLDSLWGIHTDVQFRMDENVQLAKQNLLRAGLIYYLKPNLNLTAGYAYINAHNTELNAYATEHRIWEQLLYTHPLSSLSMTHRFRVEQRFVEQLRETHDGTISTGSHKTGNRLRYFNRTLLDFDKSAEARQTFYIALQNEVFANVAAPALNSNFFDQNRFLVAFGIFHDKKTRLELGYMNQFLNPYRQPNIMNHILHVSVLQTLNFAND